MRKKRKVTKTKATMDIITRKKKLMVVANTFKKSITKIMTKVKREKSHLSFMKRVNIRKATVLKENIIYSKKY